MFLFPLKTFKECMSIEFLSPFIELITAACTFLEGYLFLLFLGLFSSGVILTILSRGIQFRAFPEMIRLLTAKPVKENPESAAISPRKALFTAMSTTIGIGNIVGPVVAIGFGGPGALVCYILASIFGAATTYTEVALSLIYRKKNADGSISGGPMPYLQAALSSSWATVYALSAAVLLMAWSTSQSNTLACLIEPYGIARYQTGLFFAITVLIILLSGLKIIANVSEALVPVMFTLYCGATLWIIGCHASELPAAFKLIFTSFLNPSAVVAGAGTYSFFETLRWGFARAAQANEAGIGTATIPHSMSQSTSSFTQGVLAMASVFSNGIVCLLSGLVILVGTQWSTPGTVFDAQLMASAFTTHFNGLGGIDRKSVV